MKVALHELKTEQPWFSEIARGIKDFEVREHDRIFEVGDLLNLREYDKNYKCYSGRHILARIKKVMSHEEFPLAIRKGYCILGIERLSQTIQT